MEKVETTKVNKKKFIHLRVHDEDHEYVKERAMDGFGSGRPTMTNFVLYAIHHVDDASPIVLSFVDELIRTIGDNRQPLAEVHADMVGIVGEVKAIGHNVNQIAKAINTTLKYARNGGMSVKEMVSDVLQFQGEVGESINTLATLYKKYEPVFRPANTRVNNVLRKEDGILTKTLCFPRVGRAQQLPPMLLRMLEEYTTANPEATGLTVNQLSEDLRRKVQEDADGGISTKEERR